MTFDLLTRGRIVKWLGLNTIFF